MVLRYAENLVESIREVRFSEVRGSAGIKEATSTINGTPVKLAMCIRKMPERLVIR